MCVWWEKASRGERCDRGIGSAFTFACFILSVVLFRLLLVLVVTFG